MIESTKHFLFTHGGVVVCIVLISSGFFAWLWCKFWRWICHEEESYTETLKRHERQAPNDEEAW